jgi:spermidine/putrescine-binding protein
MKLSRLAVALVATTVAATTVQAEGVLNIYNWEDYTNPDLIAKFEATYDVKVTITDYDLNETALAKARLGNTGFDIAVPSQSHLPIWIAEGRLLETNPGQMENGTIELMLAGDFAATIDWNGSAVRQRLENPAIALVHPKEGVATWSDNVVVLAEAQNIENAKLFQNFIMDPKNAALISAFARYANGIAGPEAFMPDDMKGAPELTIAASALRKSALAQARTLANGIKGGVLSLAGHRLCPGAAAFP